MSLLIYNTMRLLVYFLNSFMPYFKKYYQLIPPPVTTKKASRLLGEGNYIFLLFLL